MIGCFMITLDTLLLQKTKLEYTVEKTKQELDRKGNMGERKEWREGDEKHQGQINNITIGVIQTLLLISCCADLDYISTTVHDNTE